jgi:hypothetical protein
VGGRAEGQARGESMNRMLFQSALPVDGIDVVNAFLITVIRDSPTGTKTVMVDSSLENYIWDTPLAGSNDCSTYRGPGEHFLHGVQTWIATR